MLVRKRVAAACASIFGYSYHMQKEHFNIQILQSKKLRLYKRRSYPWFHSNSEGIKRLLFPT